MGDVLFQVGESATFDESIKHKYFHNSIERSKREFSKYGSLLSMVDTIEQQEGILGKISKFHKKDVKKSKNPRMSLKKALMKYDITGEFFIGVFYKRRFYYVFTENIDVFLLRNEELRELSDKKNQYVESDIDYYFGEHVVFKNDRIAAFTDLITNVLTSREIKDILLEYKENVSSQELLNSASSKIQDEKMLVLTIKVNNLNVVFSSKNIKPFLFTLFIILLSILVIKIVFDSKIPFKNIFDTGDKIIKDVKDNNNENDEKEDNIKVIKNINLPLKSITKWSASVNGSISSSPVVYKNSLYICSKDKYIYCYDLDTKKLKWKKFMAYKIGATPYLDSSGLYIGTYKGYFYKLSKKTGKIIWKYGTGKRIVSSADSDDKHVYFGSNDSFVYALNKNNAELLWRVRTDNIVWSSPVIDSENLYVGSLDHYIYAINKKTGKIKWKRQVGNQIYSSPVIKGNKLLIGASDNNLYCINKNTGGILWSFGAQKEIAGKINTDEAGVYFGTENGKFYKINILNGELIWEYQAGDVIRSLPKLTNRIVYFTSYDGFVYALKKDDGKLVWKGNMEGSIYASVELIENGVVAADLEGNIKIFERDIDKLKPINIESGQQTQEEVDVE